jgi:hypothetical protein
VDSREVSADVRKRNSEDSTGLRIRHDYREGIVFRYELMIGRVTGQFYSEESAAQLIC